MRIYVAGGSDERLTVVRPYIDRLLAIGHVITHDWTRCEGYDRPHADQERAWWAMQDLVGVSMADVVWLIMPEAKSEGAGSELGGAIILKKRVLVSGTHARRNIFALLASEIHATHEEAFRVLDLAGEDRR